MRSQAHSPGRVFLENHPFSALVRVVASSRILFFLDLVRRFWYWMISPSSSSSESQDTCGLRRRFLSSVLGVSAPLMVDIQSLRNFSSFLGSLNVVRCSLGNYPHSKHGTVFCGLCYSYMKYFHFPSLFSQNQIFGTLKALSFVLLSESSYPSRQLQANSQQIQKCKC